MMRSSSSTVASEHGHSGWSAITTVKPAEFRPTAEPFGHCADGTSCAPEASEYAASRHMPQPLPANHPQIKIAITRFFFFGGKWLMSYQSSTRAIGFLAGHLETF